MELMTFDDTIRELSDLELAALVCLVGDQHCIISAPANLLDDVGLELQLIASDVLAVPFSVVDCSEKTTLAEFTGALVRGRDDEAFPAQGFLHEKNSLDNRKIVNMIIAKNLNQASNDVQIQALELMRTRRVYSNSALHTAPKHFLFVALISSSLSGPPFLTPHLNDHFFICQQYDPSDVLPNLATHQPSDAASIASQASVIRKPPANDPAGVPTATPLITEATIAHLQKLVNAVRTTAEIRRYTHNITTFLRLHRAVAGGISALSSRHFSLLARILPPLHSLSYVTPSLVALAARKVWLHRLEIATPDNERSMQWGSSRRAVAEALAGMTPEVVVEEALAAVEVPL